MRSSLRHRAILIQYLYKRPFRPGKTGRDPGIGSMRIAVVGSGISGLGAAWALARQHDVVVFEREPRAGGHAHTLEVEDAGGRLAVDTGFMVYNERNYPELSRLFAVLGVESQPTGMSFSVSRREGGRIREWAGGNGAGGVFAQGRRLADAGHWRLLAGIARFNRVARRALAAGRADGTLGDFLRAHGLSRALAEHYLVPMTAAIWSCPPRLMLDAPAGTILGFLANHGLLELHGRPRWRSLAGGSVNYVRRLLAASGTPVRLATPVTGIARHADGVRVATGHGRESFDACVLACHADDALALMDDADRRERGVLGAFGFSASTAFVHRDPAFMPAARRAWASWNVRMDGGSEAGEAVRVTYWLNRLQCLPGPGNLFVTLNPARAPRDTIAVLDYTHPVLDAVAVQAQQELPAIQGRGGLYYAGAWTRYGFHEDGLASGLAAARAIEADAARGQERRIAV